ncbi:hypothetical protein AB0C28_29850 [Nonomuraea sp. NPDC048892]
MKLEVGTMFTPRSFSKVHVEAELAKLDTSGWRPLRPTQLRELGLTP